ncbi:glycosyltransferase family 4 protein [Mangrovimonas aestuarii]|uniref:glycosyltransferase family 4 protein n=1 Tax=Mangrovimonas aestuarii TaxID=3018443 RepID=UPI002378C782|nr:glycosyltransferase family 4 protein [Mangrovimonas aestuarii]
MRNLLYIGNRLSNSKANVSSIQLHGAQLENEGYGVWYASTKNNKLFRLLDMVGSCFIHAKKADRVIIDTYSTQNFYYALIVGQCCRLLNLKYIPSLNGGNLPYRLKRNPYLSKLIFKHAYAMVSPSRYLQEAFASYGYKNVIFIPNALHIEDYPFLLRNISSIKLLWVRSFSNIYNPAMAVKVLKILKDSGYTTELCMVGPDSDGSLAGVKALANTLGVTVKFTGKLSKKEWTTLAKEYNVFINTTNFDNMPVSVIEVMALGLPIVSTNVGGMPYLIEDNKEGLLVPANDEEAMADAILRLHGDSTLTESLALAARKKVEDYDWEVVKGLWKEVLCS